MSLTKQQMDARISHAQDGAKAGTDAARATVTDMQALGREIDAEIEQLKSRDASTSRELEKWRAEVDYQRADLHTYNGVAQALSVQANDWDPAYVEKLDMTVPGVKESAAKSDQARDKLREAKAKVEQLEIEQASDRARFAELWEARQSASATENAAAKAADEGERVTATERSEAEQSVQPAADQQPSQSVQPVADEPQQSLADQPQQSVPQQPSTQPTTHAAWDTSSGDGGMSRIDDPPIAGSDHADWDSSTTASENRSGVASPPSSDFDATASYGEPVGL